jgi:hypothetical protein
MQAELPICPEHGRALKVAKTKWGLRHACPDRLCTVALWDRSTSTPADQETRTARRVTHMQLDTLWRRGLYHRTTLYACLAIVMKMTKAECHIGKMDQAQCARVRKFCKLIRELK